MILVESIEHFLIKVFLSFKPLLKKGKKKGLTIVRPGDGEPYF